MPEPGIAINNLKELQEFFLRVVARSEHHAEEVFKTIFPIFGAVLTFRDPDSELRVHSQEGGRKNTAWIWLNNTRYYIGYEHKTKEINVRVNNWSKKNTIKTFKDGVNEPSEIISYIRSLSKFPSEESIYTYLGINP